LSLSGKEEWGGIFLYGRIPIHRISVQKIMFETFADPESVMAVDWKQLSEEQREAILERLRQQGTASLEAVLADMLKFGLPIRRSQIDCCGIKEWNYLC
jgi:hypothetical protein